MFTVSTVATYFQFNDLGDSVAVFDNLISTHLILNSAGNMLISLRYLHTDSAVFISYSQGSDNVAKKDYDMLLQHFTEYLRFKGIQKWQGDE